MGIKPIFYLCGLFLGFLPAAYGADDLREFLLSDEEIRSRCAASTESGDDSCVENYRELRNTAREYDDSERNAIRTISEAPAECRNASTCDAAAARVNDKSREIRLRLARQAEAAVERVDSLIGSGKTARRQEPKRRPAADKPERRSGISGSSEPKR